jgi:hypothetical protein
MTTVKTTRSHHKATVNDGLWQFQGPPTTFTLPSSKMTTFIYYCHTLPFLKGLSCLRVNNEIKSAGGPKSGLLHLHKGE